MKASLARRLQWMAGVVSVWGLTWSLLGIRTLVSIHNQPHPLLKGMKLTGVMLTAVAIWFITTFLVSLAIGLITGFITLVGIGDQDVSRLSFKQGSVIGAATFLWFHGVLFTQVPVALGSIPGIGKMPMALCLMIFLGTGAALMAWAIWPAARNVRWLRWAGTLVVITLFIHVPHDLFRRMMPGPPPLPTTQRRLMIVSIDALRRDTFEQAMPEWKAPAGVTPICAYPATRLAWNSLLGASAERMRYGKVMPTRSELEKPDDLVLLRMAEIRGVRTAFVIDDSMTPSYSLQPSLFTTVLEPDGGWKYWFTLGYGTSWPAYSWLQNYLSPVETNNPWADTDAYYRDLGRQLKNHAWVSTHTCELHAPIVLRFEELRALSGWKWLGRSAYSYEPYSTFDEIRQDGGTRVGPRASAQRHYTARSGFMLARLKPFLELWAREFPELSGVVTADHGETFPGILGEGDQLVSTFSGVHGFRLDADAIYIPLHPFGRTTWKFQPDDLFSWFDLRDDIFAWLEHESPLNLTPSPAGRVIQISTIQAEHLEPPATLATEKKTGITSGPSLRDLVPKAHGGGGIRLADIMFTIHLNSNGLWYCEDLTKKDMDRTIFSTALAKGSRLSIYNPQNDGSYLREDWDGYLLKGLWNYTSASVEQDLKAFNQTHQLPSAPKE